MDSGTDKLSIKKLKFVRNFLDFNSDILLSKKTAIYAPNGSGKTNLSRLLQYVKDADRNLDDLRSDEAGDGDTVEFKLVIGSREISDTNYKDVPERELLNRIQVFNSDFIEKNINTPNFSDHDVSGEVKVELGDAEEKIKKAENKRKDLIEKRKASYESIQNILSDTKERLINIEKKYTNSDYNIWKELDITKIISSEFELKDQWVTFIKQPEQVEKYKTCESYFTEVKSINDDDKIEYAQLAINLPDFENIKNELANPVVLPEVDAQTENNLKFLHQWLHGTIAHDKSTDEVIKSAIELSEQDSVSKCILCKRALDDDVKTLFNNYKKYFEAEKAKFESAQRTSIQELSATKSSLEKIDNKLETNTKQLCRLFSLENTWINIDTENEVTAIQVYIDKINEKISSPSEPLTVDLHVKKYIKEINISIETNRKLCEKINIQIKNAQTRASQVRTLIGQKYLYDILVGQESKINDLSAFKEKLADAGHEIQELQKRLPSQNVRDGIKKLFNTFLHKRVGIDKYEVDIIDDRIVLKLLNHNISQKTERISEGEKVMIGLCYFFASCIGVLNDFEKIKDAIFVIDDPVSSTSYGNFFGVSSLINHFEEDIRNSIWPDMKSDINIQKIVLTHNTQFFNLIQAHIFKSSKNSQYLMLRDDCFVALNKETRLSEFQTALLRINDYSNGNSSLNVGNDIRRVIETFKHFYGLKEFDETAVATIFHFAGREELGSFYTLIQHTSHLTPEESSDPLPPEIMQNGVRQFITLIEHVNSPFRQAWIQIQSMEDNN